jgi:prevent-host-death family protein
MVFGERCSSGQESALVLWALDLAKYLVYNLTDAGQSARVAFPHSEVEVMTMIVNVHEAKTQLSRLLLRISQGEEVIIARDGKPVARLVPYASQPARRVAGSARGQVGIAPDFDAPLPDELLAAFEA